MLTFSNKRKYSGNIAFSPDSKYFAISKGLELIIYDNKYLKPYQNCSFVDFIEDIQWSKNSKLILVGLYKRARCEIRSIENPKWYCSIDEGVKGMKYSLFSPDSLHILSICDHNIKLSIRSLVDKSLLYINFPKYARKGLSFSSKGNFMALAERNEAKDYIGVYFVNKWTCIKKFLTQTEDLQDVKWSYDNSALLIPDTPTLCILYIYSPIGDLISKIELYQYKMGIKSMDISPNGHYICLGLYDQSLRIFNNISYTCVTIFEHDKEILNDIKVNYYKEEILNNEGESKYIQIKPPIDLRNENILKNKNNYINDKVPKIGISKMAFSFDNYFLATKNDKMPNILFIWDLNQMNLQFVLIQINEVVHFEWGKKDNILFISTNNNKLYYFTLDSCKILQLPKDFNNKSLIFSPDGTKMIMKDINNFIMVNIDNDENINTKIEENYINGDKEGNIDENINEDEIENNIEGEEMEEQINEEDNNNVVFEEEIGMNPDS
jgi:WD40 repeat protein